MKESTIRFNRLNPILTAQGSNRAKLARNFREFELLTGDRGTSPTCLACSACPTCPEPAEGSLPKEAYPRELTEGLSPGAISIEIA